MNNPLLLHIGRFLLLVILQVLLLNHIDFLGYINPYLYILFILLYPPTDSRMTFIFVAFLLGLSVDIFSDSGGAHAAASVFIAYIRPLLARIAFGSYFEQQAQGIYQATYAQLAAYVLLMVIIHHFIVFWLEAFSLSGMLNVLQKTLYSGLFTFILSILSISLFSKK